MATISPAAYFAINVTNNNNGGGQSYSTPIFDASGDIFGTASRGGSSQYGTVFELPAGTSSPGTVSNVYTFSNSSSASTLGVDPAYSGVVLSGGNLYGTTYKSNSNGFPGFTETGNGAVYEISPASTSGSASLLFSFNTSTAAGSVGANPRGGLIADSAGNLYGTTTASAANGKGAVYEIPAGTSTPVLIAPFTSTSGNNMLGNLVRDSQGDLFGTAQSGGAHSDGTVFEVASGSNTVTPLYSFNNNGSNTSPISAIDGKQPMFGLTADAAGNLYGTTVTSANSNSSGGSYPSSGGTVFELTKSGSSYSFGTIAVFNGEQKTTNVNDVGYQVDSGVIVDAVGDIFGMTNGGGYTADTNNGGVFYEITANNRATGTITPLYDFDANSTVGHHPYGGLTADSKGNIWGVTYNSGLNNGGTLFEFTQAQTGYALTVGSSGPATLTWNNSGGTGTGTTWDITSQNWNNGTAPATYSNTSNTSTGDSVIFNDANNANYNVTISGTVNPTAVTFNNSTGTYNVSGTNSSSGIAGPTSLVLNNPGTVNLSSTNTYTGGTFVKNGQLTLIGSAAFPAVTNLSIGVLSTAATVVYNAHSGSTATALQVNSLSLAGTSGAWLGKLDLTNNAMTDHVDSLGFIFNAVAQGYAGGNWNAAGGIVSSTAAADPTHLTALGVMQNNQNGTPLYNSSNMFAGVVPGASDVLVKYTYYGDANLDGMVNTADYTLIDTGYLSSGPQLSGWGNGDFNYDGVINGSDYTLIDNAFNQQGAPLSAQIAGEIAAPTAQIAGQIAGGTTAVPEPASLALLAIAPIGLLARRRRR